MSIRATDGDVRATVPDVPSGTNLSRYIRRANVLTEKVVAADSDGELTDDQAREIEVLLAAHFYAHYDPQYSSRSTGGASGSFQGQTGMRLESTMFGQDAMMMDTTGYLKRLNQAQKPMASAYWGGRLPVDQTDYQDRNV